MEHGSPGPEKQDDSNAETRSKKKRSASRLSQYLSGLRGKETKDRHEAAGEKADEKPKRFRRLFNKIFPKVVENPSQEEAGEQQHDFDYESRFSWTGLASRSESTTGITPEATIANIATKSVEDQGRSVEQGTEHQRPIDTPEDPVETPPASETSDEQWTPPEVPAPSSGDEVFIQQRADYETQQATPAVESSTKEVIVERGSGAVLPVVLVGAEYLARKKADRKLEGRMNEKIKDSKEKLDHTAVLQQELETVVKQNREQLEALKRAREGQAPVESGPSARNTIERPPTAPKERITTVEQPIRSPEAAKYTPEVKEQPRLVVEREVKQEVQPEKILEQVVDAAEHDMPVERIFERSHEVKDDKTVPGAAVSVGAVMNAQAAVNQYQDLRQAKQSVGTQGGPLPFVSDSAAHKSYKQAVKMGFWAAVMIIILGAIAYLVVK